MAVNEGCDVFSEKPLSDGLDGVDDLIRLAEATERILMVGLCFRFHRGLLRVKELVEGGAIGRLIAVRALMGEYLPDCRPGVDYRSLYIAQPGGGVTLDYIHEIDLVQWIVGASPRRIYAVADQLSDLEMQSDDMVEILLEFHNGVIATIHLDVFQRVRRRQSEFMGTHGTIIIDFADWNRSVIHMYRSVSGRWETETLEMDRDDMFRAEDRAFLGYLVSRGRPVLDGREGEKSLRIALAAMDASRRSAAIEF
jgi:predicted dehydrogenase